MKTTSPVACRQPVNQLELTRFFTGVGARLRQRHVELAPSHSEVKRFFSRIRHTVGPQQRLLDRKQATRFNVFDFIEPDENRLSDVLAWLLDPQESHGQGDLFLRLIFRQLRLSYNAKLTGDAKVRREVPTHGIEKYRRR